MLSDKHCSCKKEILQHLKHDPWPPKLSFVLSTLFLTLRGPECSLIDVNFEVTVGFTSIVSSLVSKYFHRLLRSPFLQNYIRGVS